jgi:Rrf2 family protein
MRFNSRLSVSLHALLHFAERREPLTSEALAASLHTNPVVVRQTMAGLREAGIVRSERGHGGGWFLSRDVASISVRDVYVALGGPALFLLRNRSENADCIVEKAVNKALTCAFSDAQALLIDRLGSISLASLSAEFHQHVADRHEHTEVCSNAV